MSYRNSIVIRNDHIEPSRGKSEGMTTPNGPGSITLNFNNDQSSHLVESSPLSDQSVAFNKIVSDEVVAYFETFINLWILFLITGLGVVTNLLNILVFWRQGFKDGVNISMTTIACWDLLKCGTGFFLRLYGPVGLVSTAAAISWQNLTFPLAYTPIFAGYVSYALTTYVSIERCLCVTKPFTVKAVFTPRFTLIAVATISIVVFGAYVVMYFIYEVAFVFSPNFNTTVAIYRYSSFFYANQATVMVYYKYVGILLPFASLMVLCLCSATTVYQLRKSSRFLLKDNNRGITRNNEFSLKIKSGISLRQKQVVKMLLAVVMVNIGNLFPRIVFYVAQLIEPELYLLRRYHNVFYCVAVWLFVLDFLNASINFFLFLSMGSLFRIKFYAMFGSWRRPGKI